MKTITATSAQRLAGALAASALAIAGIGCHQAARKSAAETSPPHASAPKKARPNAAVAKTRALPPTNSPGIAVADLNARIDGLKTYYRVHKTVAAKMTLAGAYLTRGEALGSIADLEHALELSKEAAKKQPNSPKALFGLARAESTFHRFGPALADIKAAEKHGASKSMVAGARAAILLARGKSARAIALRIAAVKKWPSTRNLAALAATYAQAGKLKLAHQAFKRALAKYRDVSPFTVAWILYQEGRVWEWSGHLKKARDEYAMAVKRLPQYAFAVEHLAHLEAKMGHRDRAIALLRPLETRSDDPQYAGQLAGYLRAAGHPKEAARLVAKARKGFKKLMARFPEGFASHVTEFNLRAGNDPKAAFASAKIYLKNQPVPRAHWLYMRAALAAGDTGLACKDAATAVALPNATRRMLITAQRALKRCGHTKAAAQITARL